MAESSQLTGEPLEGVRYDTQTGLVPVVVQDVNTREVLTLAYANREALKRTFGTGFAWFWSRTRQDYWRKGETSGHVQRVREVRLDCDGDAVLYLVDPAGPACHTGHRSCFYRGLTYQGQGPIEAVCEPKTAMASEPKKVEVAALAVDGQQTVGEQDGDVARNSFDWTVLSQLWQVVDGRYRQRPAGSYTTYLFAHGVDKAAKKLGEEAVEVVIAAKNAESNVSGRQELAAESADLLYHLLVLWRSVQVEPSAVLEVLGSRNHGTR
ncbi:bifunctional phosphoribosyl-AMP cyclohydrolase/phosphoribosyl-ATP diphosphatase HisIE [Alicyclobacillaceae bacterium I2511]|nr:bifunctional phosphoribosyl-AMP cyclohydrolase/phosphoribosyl-ATP diphosphatase HisIE [Alicyclobacillaceae bacterium I2511]